MIDVVSITSKVLSIPREELTAQQVISANKQKHIVQAQRICALLMKANGATYEVIRTSLGWSSVSRAQAAVTNAIIHAKGSRKFATKLLMVNNELKKAND